MECKSRNDEMGRKSTKESSLRGSLSIVKTTKQSTNATFEPYANLELLANLNAIIYRFALAILR